MSSYDSNIYRFPLSFSAHLIDIHAHLNDLIRIEQTCFPERMQDSENDLKDFFADKNSTGLVLCKNGEAFGYLSGTHISEENSADVLQMDPFIKNNQDRIFYIDSIAIMPKLRSTKALDFLFHEMSALLKDLDYTHVVSHTRKKNGLSRLAQRKFGARIVKTYEDWGEYNEPFDYLIVDLKSVPTLPFLIDWLWTVMRQMRCLIKRIPDYG